LDLLNIVKHLSDFCKFVRVYLALTLSPSLHCDFGNSSEFGRVEDFVWFGLVTQHIEDCLILDNNKD
jgi:hypothetical protein